MDNDKIAKELVKVAKELTSGFSEKEAKRAIVKSIMDALDTVSSYRQDLLEAYGDTYEEEAYLEIEEVLENLLGKAKRM